MKRLLSKIRRWSLSLFISSVLVAPMLGGAQQVAAWGLSSSSPEQVEEALSILGRLPTLQSADLDAALLRMGFSTQPPEWATYSIKQKLRYAYRWAQAVSDDNAKTFVASLARSFEERYESLRFDPVFRDLFIGGGTPNGESVVFQRPTLTQLGAPLPADIQLMLNRLSRYVDGPGFLGRYSVAVRRFDLKGRALDDTLETKDSRSFLAHAARLASPPPEMHDRLNALMQDVLIASEGASLDSELAKIAGQIRARYGRPPSAHMAGSFVGGDGKLHREADRMRPDVPPQDTGGGGGGAPGGSPERVRAAEQLHRGFEARSYGSPSSRTFHASVGRSGGRGGVIAGAHVSTTLGRFESIEVEIPSGVPCETPGRARAKGSVVVRTSSTGTYRMDGIDCDVLIAASRLVFEDFGDGLWQQDRAIGVATIDTERVTRTFRHFLPADGDPSRYGVRRRMLLHPALVDLDIGRSIAFLDLWPTASLALLESAGNAPSVALWLKSLGDGGVSTWKWIDSPAEVRANGNTLRVMPQGRSHMLAFRSFTRSEASAELAACSNPDAVARCTSLLEGGSAGTVSTSFDAAATILVKTNRDFAKAEQLLTVLAIFKQARIHGISQVAGKTPLAVPRAKTPTYLITGWDRNYVAARYNESGWQADCQEFARTFAIARRKVSDSISFGDEQVYRRRIASLERELLLTGLVKDDGNGLAFNCS